MTDIDPTQAEADALLAMKKVRVTDTQYDYPSMGGSIHIPLKSEDRREEFFLDVARGRFDFRKGTLQNRARQIIILARLDYGGPAHPNPDGEEIPCPHLHLYKEGYGDKWAFPIPLDRFPNIGDQWDTLFDFMKYINVIKQPAIIRELFT